MAHAASVYYTSGYNNSSILIVDETGQIWKQILFSGNNNKISLLKKNKYHGIGALYSAVTKEILNLGTGSEVKLWV